MTEATAPGISDVLKNCTAIGAEPETEEQILAMMRAAQTDEDIHTKAAKDAHERVLGFAEKLRTVLPKA